MTHPARTGQRRRSATVAVALGCLLSVVACSESDDRETAVATLVDVRGMPETLAQCTVDRLEQREVDLDEIGDGRVDPVEHPEVIEAVAACAALDAAQDEPDAD